jgi:hypothetical protein
MTKSSQRREIISSEDHLAASDAYDGALLSRQEIKKEITKRVIRCKLSKRRHLVLKEVIRPSYLDSIFPSLLKLFDPQKVNYNGGIAAITEWKISCYLEVMNGGIPTTKPNLDLLQLFQPILDTCSELFLHWYRQQHACNNNNYKKKFDSCRRLMTFITRYTPAPGEQALLKVSTLFSLIHSLSNNQQKYSCQ